MSEETPPEEKVIGQPFYVDAFDRLRATANEVRAQHPEVRSALIILEYSGSLNDTNLVSSLAVTPSNALDSVAAFGLLQNTIKAMNYLMKFIETTQENMRNETLKLARELTERLNERERSKEAQDAHSERIRKITTAGYVVEGVDEWQDFVWVDKGYVYFGWGRKIFIDSDAKRTYEELAKIGYQAEIPLEQFQQDNCGRFHRKPRSTPPQT